MGVFVSALPSSRLCECEAWLICAEVVEQGAALTYELHESAFSRMIFTVGSHVFRQVGDTV